MKKRPVTDLFFRRNAHPCRSNRPAGFVAVPLNVYLTRLELTGTRCVSEGCKSQSLADASGYNPARKSVIFGRAEYNAPTPITPGLNDSAVAQGRPLIRIDLQRPLPGLQLLNVQQTTDVIDQDIDFKWLLKKMIGTGRLKFLHLVLFDHATDADDADVIEC